MALLDFSPLISEGTFTVAADHFEYIEFVLALYDKSHRNIFCITGDNAESHLSIYNTVDSIKTVARSSQPNDSIIVQLFEVSQLFDWLLFKNQI